MLLRDYSVSSRGLQELFFLNSLDRICIEQLRAPSDGGWSVPRFRGLQLLLGLLPHRAGLVAGLESLRLGMYMVSNLL